VTLEITAGEFMVLVGPSGCGKTTLLNLIAGLEEATSGKIVIGDRDVTDLAPRDRDVAMVFQNYSLYPHMTVRKNLAYGLKVRRTPRKRIEERVSLVADMLAIGELLDRKPANLSGGQQQRVAMGRAIVREPAAFLMDEPLSNLDAKLRVEMRGSLNELHQELGVTTVYVTHDQVEAMTLGERVAVMSGGRVQQVDDPQTLYHDPANVFVASFIGSPAMNLVEAVIDSTHAVFSGHRVELDPSHRPPSNGRVILGIRPEDLEDASFAATGLPTIEVEAVVCERLGSETQVMFTVSGAGTRHGHQSHRPDPSQEEGQLLASEALRFTARVDPRSTVRPGERLLLAVDPRRLYFFDVDTGVSTLTTAMTANLQTPVSST
jgi:multiple sugar transport system ATP-binding protein